MTREQKRRILAEATDWRRYANHEEVQAALARLGDMAIPPRGHRCPDCSRPDALYCYAIAAQRFREEETE